MQFTEEVVEGIKKLGGDHSGGFHQEGIEVLYDNVSPEYEKLMIAMGHPDPEECGNMTVQLIGENLTKCHALDLGCGTGMVG